MAKHLTLNTLTYSLATGVLHLAPIGGMHCTTWQSKVRNIQRFESRPKQNVHKRYRENASSSIYFRGYDTGRATIGVFIWFRQRVDPLLILWHRHAPYGLRVVGKSLRTQLWLSAEASKTTSLLALRANIDRISVLQYQYILDVYDAFRSFIMHLLRHHHEQSPLPFPWIFNLYSFCLYSFGNGS